MYVQQRWSLTAFDRKKLFQWSHLREYARASLSTALRNMCTCSPVDWFLCPLARAHSLKWLHQQLISVSSHLKHYAPLKIISSMPTLCTRVAYKFGSVSFASWAKALFILWLNTIGWKGHMTCLEHMTFSLDRGSCDASVRWTSFVMVSVLASCQQLLA